MLTHGVSSEDFNQCIIIPIPKDKRKSLSDSNNYRGIALSSSLNKLFEYVLLELTQDFLCSSDLQFGYKEGHSTNLCSFLVGQTIEYYLNNGSNVLALFLDASKAFDRVNHDKLFNDLLCQGLCPVIVRIVFNMYKLNSGKIRWNGFHSKEFKMTNGVKQGGIMSPLLFSFYLDPLLKRITNSGSGCYVGNRPGNVYGFADDLIILAPTITSLKNLIRICEIYSQEYLIQFNPSKSYVIPFTKDKIKFEVDIYMNGTQVNYASSINHLGIVIKNSGKLFDFGNLINEMKIKTNVINVNFNSIDSMSKIKLFNSQCMSLYGCTLFNLEDHKLKVLEVNWRKCCRSLMKLHNRTHNSLIPFLVNSQDIRTIIEERILNFIITGLQNKNNIVLECFKELLLTNHTYILCNLNIILTKHNISYLEIFNGKKLKLNYQIMMSNGRQILF